MTKFYKGKNDSMFKAIFCNPKNTDLLEVLISDSLKRKVKILKIFPPEILKNNIYEKGKTLDVLVESEGEIYNIEVNTNYYKDLHIRNASYIFSKYSEEVRMGNDYYNMKHFIQINFTSNLSNKKPLAQKYELIDKETKDKFVDNLTIFEYNVDRIKDSYFSEGNEEYKFVAALDCNKEELKKLCKGDRMMEKFEENVNKLNNDSRFTTFLTEEEDMEKLRNTWIHYYKEEGKELGLKEGIKEGKEIGIKEGKAEGITESKLEIAKNMLKKEMDMKTISEITGLSIKEIETLK